MRNKKTKFILEYSIWVSQVALKIFHFYAILPPLYVLGKEMIFLQLQADAFPLCCNDYKLPFNLVVSEFDRMLDREVCSEDGTFI